MKKFKDSVFLLVLLSISILITACSSSDDGVSNNPINDSEATANLTIKVVDASDVNQKLDGTYVRIEGESELKTGTQGTVTFNLKANNTYTISVMPTKDGYIATEGINIDLTNKDKEKTIKVAQELVTETISADTTEVGNGLADMELDDTVKTELAGKEVSVAKAEKTVIDLIDESSADSTGGFDPATEKVLGETYSFKITSGTTDITSQSNILAVNKAIISSTDASDIPAITMKLDLSNLVDDMNNINGDKYGLLAVIIATDGTPAFKKIKGTDININRETGKISGKVPIKDANGNLVAEVNLSIIETKDVDEIEENKETTVEDAKEFVSDLKGHGVNLKEVGKGQAQKIETNIKQDVVPYLVAMGYRLEKVEEVLDVWSELFGLAAENIYAEYPEDIGYGPGDYTIDLSKKEAYDDYINLAYNNWSKYEEEALLYYFPDYNDYRTDWEQYQQENYYTYYQYRDYYFGEHNSQYNDYYEDEVYEFVDGYIEKAIRNEAEEATNFIIAKQLDENPREIDKWEWNLTFANSQEKVTIGINNPQDILSIEEVDSQEYEGYEKAIIDFTKADFSYLHTSGTDSTMNWSLDFTVDGAETQTIKQVDIDEYSWEDSNGVNIVRYRYDDTFIIPTKGSIKVTGIMKDSLNFTDEDGVFVDMYEDGIYDTDDELPVDVPAIGEVVLGAVVNIDLTDSKSISYNGSFDSEEFDYQGDAEVKFAKFPSSLQAIADGDESPVVSSFNSSGEFTTKVFKISGSTKVDFVFEEVEEDNIIFPNTINFAGSYQDMSVDNGFALNGSLDIDLGVENVDLKALYQDSETHENYLGGTVTLNGQLKDIKYGDVNLDIKIVRDGYEHLTTDFRYDYSGDKFIEGEVIVGANSDYKLTAYNQANLQLIMTEYADAEQEKIGEIRNYYGTKIYGEIIAADDPFVQFSDNTIMTILPDKE